MENFCFADGHVKALKLGYTLSTSEGGSGTVDAWTRDGSSINNGVELQIIQSSLAYYH
jgi:hypothetical protein